jgi:hypothetical protein
MSTFARGGSGQIIRISLVGSRSLPHATVRVDMDMPFGVKDAGMHPFGDEQDSDGPHRTTLSRPMRSSHLSVGIDVHPQSGQGRHHTPVVTTPDPNSLSHSTVFRHFVINFHLARRDLSPPVPVHRPTARLKRIPSNLWYPPQPLPAGGRHVLRRRPTDMSTDGIVTTTIYAASLHTIPAAIRRESLLVPPRTERMAHH